MATTTIVPKRSMTSFYVNKPFDVSFDVSSAFSLLGTVTYQLCNSYSGLAPYTSNGVSFTGTIPTSGFKQYVQVDALVPTGSSVVTTFLEPPVAGTIAFPAWDSNGVMYFAGGPYDTQIFSVTADGSYSLFAGQTTSGFTDGDRLTTAKFVIPRGITFDSNGDMLIASYYNVRKITMSTGVVSTIAGPSTSTRGFVDGTGATARFAYALSIKPEFGGTGDFIITDYDNNCIRRMTPGGAVTTILGNGSASGWPNGVNSAGYLDATGTAARFRRPVDIVYTASGDMLICDQFNFRIRKASPTMVVTTYAGNGSSVTANGTLTTAGFGYPTGIELDLSENIYVPEFYSSVIRRVVGSNVTTWAGAVNVNDYVNGSLCNARFQTPENIRRNGTTLYVADRNARIRAIYLAAEANTFVSRPAGFTVLASSNYPITVNSRIDVSWTSVGGSLPLYKYEPFSNTFTANGSGGTTTDTLTYSTASTELLAYLTGTGTSNVAFRGPNGANITYPYPLTLSVRANSNGAVVDDVSTSVTISPARIIVTPCNTSLTFYRNEPSANPVFSFVSSSAQLIYSATTLPAGLSFTRTASNAFALTGTPTVQTFASNYSILGQDTSGRTYTIQVSMVVNPERLIIDVSGSLALSGLSSNAPIQPITFTSRFPPYNSDRAVTYSWFPAPPAGLQFARKGDIPVTGLSASISSLVDASFELTLSGTITSNQIRTYASSNITSTSIVFNGVRTNGGGLLSPAIPKTITFSFAEAILFDSNVPRLYVGLPVSNFYYSAKTYFPFPVDTSIASIELTDGFIPDGLDASFTQTTQRFTFTGTPTTATPYTFTLQASNSNGTTFSLPITLTPSNDTITITPITDACYNFIQFRPLSSGKDGFYSPPLRYTATSASGGNVVLTGTNLPTGVSVATIDASAGIYDLSGVPTTSAGSSIATLNALVGLTGATTTKTFRYSVSAEVFTFNDLSLAFTENVPITPVTVVATTLSEQPIIRYSSPSIPAELQIANTGRITGEIITSANGTFDVTAYTPYSSGTKTYSYTVTPDSVLLQPASYRTVTAPGCNVSIQINAYSASATTVSNFQISGGSYGLGIGSTSGLLSGTLSSSLPTTTTFTLAGSAGDVTGTLVGTMITDNLTVNRAQILRNDWANFFPNVTTLRILSSDTDGASWTQRYSQSNNLYAAMIGTNGSNLYLVPTSSNVVLSSTDTVTFGSNSYDVSSSSPYATSIVNKPGTSTWWMVGTAETASPPTRGTFLYTSSNDGVTWSRAEITTGGFTARDKNLSSSGHWSPYINGGAALAYKDGVLLLGGNRILRSTDDGLNWSTVTGGFTLEVASFSVDHESVWIAAGSDTYETISNAAWSGTTANTICYSTDAGLSWTSAANGFGMNGYGVVHGGGAWIAYGLSFVYPAYFLSPLVSFDGINWATTDVSSCLGPNAGNTRPDPYRMTIGFDESDWKLVVPTTDTTVSLFTHSYDTPLLSGWTSENISSFFPSSTSNTLFSSYLAQTIDPGADITTITFPLPNTGPIFTSPPQTTFILWQYMPLPPVTFLAPGATSYFISPLPTGLSWDPVTHTLSGACVTLGTQTFTVYAQNSGLTALVITLIVEVPRIIKQQTGAGAYTSLVRQYTTVNAAQNARDTRAFPTQVSGIGEFASPYPPDVITPSNCPC